MNDPTTCFKRALQFETKRSFISEGNSAVSFELWCSETAGKQVVGMIIYQPCQTLSCDQIDIKNLAAELANTLLPKAEILSTQVKSGRAHLLIRHFNALVAFELCATAVGEGIFESILKLLLDLESTRKIQNDPLLKDVGVYLLASRFSEDFLKRLPFEVLGIHLYEWCFIRSETTVAPSNAIYLKRLEFHKDEKVTFPGIAKDSEAGLISREASCHAQLTTAEVIALASLGLEIRNSRF